MNVILVSLDCVRPDYLSCYANKNQTPFFDFINKNGVKFKKCIVQAPHTTTSHASMFTGTYPFNHGVRWVSEFKVKKPMIQEVLQDEGYKTIGLIGGWTLTQGEFARGFDIFIKDFTVTDNEEGRHVYIPINELVDNAINYLKKSEKQNNYIFIHSFDAHFTSRAEKKGNREERYKEEIRNQDKQLKKLFEYLKETDFIMTITADHGDKMPGEHGYPYVLNHKGEKVGIHFHETEIFDIQLKVPLLMIGNNLPQKYVTNWVRTVDIAPTILGLLNKTFETDVDGIDLSKYLLNDKTTEFPKTVYSETYHAQLVLENKYAYQMRAKYEWGWEGLDNLVSLQNSNWKLICTANEKLEPYLLFKVDSDETENLLQKYPKEASELFEQLKGLLKNDNQYLKTSLQFKKLKLAATKLKTGKRI